jgi:hypothetical protein
MNRREFITLLGSAAMTAIGRPFAAAAQPVTKPSIGFLSPATPVIWAPLISAFKTGLAEMGYAEGGNVTIEYRWAEGRYHRLPTSLRHWDHQRLKRRKAQQQQFPSSFLPQRSGRLRTGYQHEQTRW